MTKKAMKARIEELEKENWKLIKNLEWQGERARIQAEKDELQLRLEEARRNQNLQIERAEYKAENLAMRERLAESPYKQLSDILKVLTTKLPTLDIKEIHAHCKEK